MTKKQLEASITQRAVCKRCAISLGTKNVTAYKKDNELYCKKCVKK